MSLPVYSKLTYTGLLMAGTGIKEEEQEQVQWFICHMRSYTRITCGEMSP